MLFLTFAHTVDCDGHFTSPIALYINDDLGITGHSPAIADALMDTLAARYGDYGDTVLHFRDDESKLRDPSYSKSEFEERIFYPIYICESRDDVTAAIFGELRQEIYVTETGFHIPAGETSNGEEIAGQPRVDVATLDEALMIMLARKDAA